MNEGLKITVDELKVQNEILMQQIEKLDSG
jgi:hypothetical protein